MNQMYGFEGEVKSKYSSQMWDLFTELFNRLPLGHLVESRVMVMHGGLFSRDGVTLRELVEIDRNRQPPEEGARSTLTPSHSHPHTVTLTSSYSHHHSHTRTHSGLMCDLLWSEPQFLPGRGPSKRGVGVQFGPNVTDEFCSRNGIGTEYRSLALILTTSFIPLHLSPTLRSGDSQS